MRSGCSSCAQRSARAAARAAEAEARRVAMATPLPDADEAIIARYADGTPIDMATPVILGRAAAELPGAWWQWTAAHPPTVHLGWTARFADVERGELMFVHVSPTNAAALRRGAQRLDDETDGGA